MDHRYLNVEANLPEENSEKFGKVLDVTVKLISTKFKCASKDTIMKMKR